MKCPCCGGEIPALEADMLMDVDSFSPVERRILSAFISHYPRKISWQQLAEFVWPYGSGPDDEVETLRVFLSRLRKKLVPLGWQIPRARPGAGDISRYTLERLQ